jgi:hypothetical protein
MVHVLLLFVKVQVELSPLLNFRQHSFFKAGRKINILFLTCVLIPIKILCCISCGSYVTIVRMSLNVY